MIPVSHGARVAPSARMHGEAQVASVLEEDSSA
jgi:hypothetical protein